MIGGKEAVTESGKGLATGIVGVLLIGLMATQCQKQAKEKTPQPTATTTVRSK